MGFIILLDLIDLGNVGGGPIQRGGYLALALCIAFEFAQPLSEQILVLFHYAPYTT
jgi:hypothetical protein